MPNNFHYYALIVLKLHHQFTQKFVLLFSDVSLMEPLSSEPEAGLQQLSILIDKVTIHMLYVAPHLIPVEPTHRSTFIPALCSMLPASNYA